MSIDEEWNGDELLAAYEAAVGEGLQAAGDLILTESNLDSPTLTGDMDSTGHIEVDGKEMGIGYDHPGVRKQHENLWYEHPQGDKPKFLETAVETKAEEALEALGDPIKNVLGG